VAEGLDCAFDSNQATAGFLIGSINSVFLSEHLEHVLKNRAALHLEFTRNQPARFGLLSALQQ